MSDFPKYQISKFLDNKRDYQVVIRSDDFDELMESMNKIKPWINKVSNEEEKVKANDVYESKLPNKIVCKKHNEDMYLKDGKYGPYYSHKWGDEWCNLDGKKYLSSL